MDNTRYKLSDLDNFVKRLNYWIGRMLGMGNKNLPPKRRHTSDGVFISVVVVFILLLWCMTGFYYVGSGKKAIILHKGHMVKLITGQVAGFTYPYPWGDVYVVASPPAKAQSLNSSTDRMIFLTKDFKVVELKGKYTYQIINPFKTYTTIAKFNNAVINRDEVADINQAVQNEFIAQLHSYSSNQNLEQLKNINLTIMGEDISSKANIALLLMGIKADLQLTNLTVESSLLNEDNMVNSAISAKTKVNLASELVLEAGQYYNSQLTIAKANISRYKDLLKQYRLNPQAVVEQMYYDALTDINNGYTKKNGQAYSLLFLDLGALQAKDQQINNELESSSRAIIPNDSNKDSRDGRNSMRYVNRFGNLERR